MRQGCVGFSSLTFLGTSSGVPTRLRNVSSYALTLVSGEVWLFDAGEGTQHQLQACPSNAAFYSIAATSGGSSSGAKCGSMNALVTQVSNAELLGGDADQTHQQQRKPAQPSRESYPLPKLSRIAKIFITHLHGDHCFGLPGLMASISMHWGNMQGQAKPKKHADNLHQNGGSHDGDTAECSEEALATTHHRPFSADNNFLEIYGPPNIGHFIRGALRYSDTRFGFRFRVNEVVDPERVVESGAPLPPSYPHQDPYGEAVTLHPDEAAPRYVYAMPLSEARSDSGAELPWPYHYHLVNGSALPEEGEVPPATKIAVQAARISHRIFSLGFVLVAPQTPGRLNVEAAVRLGVPKGPLLAELKKGNSITVSASVPGADPALSESSGNQTPNQITIHAKDVTDPPTPGQTAVFLGDTCNSDAVVSLLRQIQQEPGSSAARIGNSPRNVATHNSEAVSSVSVDWLVHECTFDASMTVKAAQHGHSTSAMAGAFAKQCGAKHLILSHFSARFGPESAPLLKEEAERAANHASAPEVRVEEDDPDLQAPGGPRDQGGSAAAQQPARATTNVIIAQDFLCINLLHP